MIDVESSIVIERPPKDVFSLVGDLENEPKWHTDVAESRKISPGPIGPGTTYEFRARKPSMGIEKVSPRIVGLEPNRSIKFDTQFGKTLIQRTYRVEALGTGTKVSHRLQMEPMGMMRVMGFMMRRGIAKRWSVFLANLKAVAEK